MSFDRRSFVIFNAIWTVSTLSLISVRTSLITHIASKLDALLDGKLVYNGSLVEKKKKKGRKTKLDLFLLLVVSLHNFELGSMKNSSSSLDSFYWMNISKTYKIQ